MLQRIIFFLIIEAVGVLLLVKTDRIVKFFGRISFAENWFGPTGTYTLLRLGGGLLMFGGLVYLTGTWQRMMNAIFGV